MSGAIPMNELDRAIKLAARKTSAISDFYRAFAKGTDGKLWFLVDAGDAERVSNTELGYGMVSPFLTFFDRGRPVAMVFSSAERAGEYLEKARVEAWQVAVVCRPVKEVLMFLGLSNLYTSVNNLCATHSLMFEPKVCRGLATGSLLAARPNEPGERESIQLKVIEAADYPTNLVQVLFEVLRKHPAFRAAWLMTRGGEGGRPGPDGLYFQLVWMEPKDDAVLRELEMVAEVLRGSGGADVRTNVMGRSDRAAVATMFKSAAPFFRAPDCVVPVG